MEWRTTIARNARRGCGQCEGCSAHETGNSEFVNPGLGNPDGELVFITDEPRHPTEWEQYRTWAEYNDEWFPRFKRARGGQFISRLLDPTDFTIDNVWITDSIKCPTTPDANRSISSADTDEAFANCRNHLSAELGEIEPRGIVTLGREATNRTLRVLGLPDSKTRRVRVSSDYGRYDGETPYPLVISLHWAQRTVKQEEWVPVVQNDLGLLMGR